VELPGKPEGYTIRNSMETGNGHMQKTFGIAVVSALLARPESDAASASGQISGAVIGMNGAFGISRRCTHRQWGEYSLTYRPRRHRRYYH
jgi:hypothetical protein